MTDKRELSPEAQAALETVRQRVANLPSPFEPGPLEDGLTLALRAIAALDARLTKLERP